MLGGDELTWSFTVHGPTEFQDVRRFRLAEKALARSLWSASAISPAAN